MSRVGRALELARERWKHPSEGQEPDLLPGTIVRAKRDLDPSGANVLLGSIGFVFGSRNCYGDGNGPIVQWFRAHEDIVCMAGVCNVYPGDVVVIGMREIETLEDE